MSGPADGAGRVAVPSIPRRAGAVAALGLVGVAALLLRPLPPAVVGAASAAEPLPVPLELLLLLNPALLVVAAALIGAAVAHRVGLVSVAAGTASGRLAVRGLGLGAAWGMAFGLALAGMDAALAPWLGPAWQALVAAQPTGAAVALSSVLYGGLAEEVMLRWGVMSLVAWAAALLAGPRHRRLATVLGVVSAAGLFALAHLPVLAVQVELTAPVVVRTLVLNGAAGLLCGWLFWRHHIEAAMAAHAAMHLGMQAGRALAG